MTIAKFKTNTTKVLAVFALTAIVCSSLVSIILSGKATYGLSSNLAITSSSYIIHGPMEILSDSGFTPANGVVSGAGTAADPYVISGWNITGGEIGIRIEGTSKHFVISNNWIANTSFQGIFVNWVAEDTCAVTNNVVRFTEHDGISINNVAKALIHENDVQFSKASGIYLGGSSFCEVSQNIARHNNWKLPGLHAGVYVDWSSNNTITHNYVDSNAPWVGLGIFMIRWSHCNLVSANIVTNNSIGIQVDTNCTGNIVENNIVSKNTHNGVQILLESDFNIIRNNSVFSNEFGIVVHKSSSNSLESNNFSNNTLCIRLQWSNDNIISSNNLSKNNAGIFLSHSNRTTISDNLISENAGYGVFDGYGIDIIWSVENAIMRNKVSNNKYGIWLDNYSYNSTVFDNTVSGNSLNGIQLKRTDGNILFGNNISMNNFGINLFESAENTITHNNFINNTQQVNNYTPDYANVWDSGYPSGGNYWNDYADADLHSGPYQNETGSDGIRDNPYDIDENNVDRYPLVNLWTPTPPLILANIDIAPDTLNLKSKGKWITCYIELPEGYNASDVNRSTIMLNDTIPIDPFWIDKPLESVVGDYDDDGIPDLMVKFNRAAVIEWLGQNIAYEKATLTVMGEFYDGTPFEASDMIIVKMPSDATTKTPSEVNSDNKYVPVMPEFPSFLVLPLFMMATLLAVIVYRRKHSM